MLEYALDRGMPVSAALVGQVVAADPTASVTDRDGMVAAHTELARLIRPATPDGVATLRAERENGWWRFLGPVKLIRFLMGVTIVALLVFMGLVVQAEAPQQLNQSTDLADTMIQESTADVAYLVAYLLSAAVLGAAFGQLYRITRYIGNGTYDRRLDSTYTTNLVLGAVAGILLAILIPLDDVGSANAGLTKPVLALLGGFSARAVHRILSRFVDAVETLVRGDPRDEVEAAAAATETRAATETSQLIANVTSGVSAAGQAMAAGQTEAAQEQLASVQANLLAPGPATALAQAPPLALLVGALSGPRRDLADHEHDPDRRGRRLESGPRARRDRRRRTVGQPRRRRHHPHPRPRLRPRRRPRPRGRPGPGR